MGYDKDWEIHLALNDPDDPIHEHIEARLKEGEIEGNRESGAEKGESVD